MPFAIDADSAADRNQRVLEQSFASARMAMAITDPRQPDNPLVFVNEAFTELTGYEASEILGRNCRFLQGPDTNQACKQMFSQALAEHRSAEIDLLNYRRDGSKFFNRVFLSPVFDEHHELTHYFASQLDVTEQRRSQSLSQRREALLSRIATSLNERLLTTMSSVRSIVEGILKDASSVVAAADDISAKLIALGHLHSSVLKDDWDNLTIGTVIASITASFSGGGCKFLLSGPETATDAALSFKVAALVHDLCVASLQRGALHSGRGRIEIVWSERQDKGRERLRLVWRETSDTPFAANYLEHVCRTTGLRSDVRSFVKREADGKDVSCLVELPTGVDIADS